MFRDNWAVDDENSGDRLYPDSMNLRSVMAKPHLGLPMLAAFHLNKSGAKKINDVLWKYDLGAFGGFGSAGSTSITKWMEFKEFIFGWIFRVSKDFLDTQTAPIELYPSKPNKLWVEPFLTVVAEKTFDMSNENKPQIYDLQNMKHMLERELTPSDLDFEQLLRDFVTLELVSFVLGMRSGNQDGNDKTSPSALFKFSGGVSMSAQIFSPSLDSVMPVTDSITEKAIDDNPEYDQDNALPFGIGTSASLRRLLHPLLAHNGTVGGGEQHVIYLSKVECSFSTKAVNLRVHPPL